MPDPIVQNEFLKHLMDAYRVFSQEMNLIRMEKADLVRSILKRFDQERIEMTRKNIKSNTYGNPGP